MTPKIELIYFAGCPNAESARANLRRALGELQLPAAWTEWEQSDAGAPAYVRSYDSPTVLVDGRDVTGAEAGTSGAACRADGAPSWETIAEAVRGR